MSVKKIDNRTGRTLFKFAKDITGNEGYIITGYKSQESVVSIPSFIGNVEVTKIKENAFCDQNQITEIDVSDGVVKIGDNAFCGCCNLHMVNLPDTVSLIGKGAFENCKNLNKVRLSKNVIVLEDRLFCGCENLIEIVVPDNVRKIGFRTFEGCTKLERIILPERFEMSPLLKAYYGIADNVLVIQENIPASNQSIAEASVGDIIQFGNYPHTKDNVESPIEWIVLDEDDGKKLLFAKNSLEYYVHGMVVKWSNSTVRLRLNTKFLNKAFDDNERKFICFSSLKKERKIIPNVIGTEVDMNTEDLIFLLSLEELLKYNKPEVIEASCTEYAENVMKNVHKELGGWETYGWMLRSNVCLSWDVAVVDKNGKYLKRLAAMIRPAIWVCAETEKVTFEGAVSESGHSFLEIVTYILSGSELQVYDLNDFIITYIKKNSKKIISKLIDQKSYKGLDKVLSIEKIMTVKAWEKLIDKVSTDNKTEITAYLLKKKKEVCG